MVQILREWSRKNCDLRQYYGSNHRINKLIQEQTKIKRPILTPEEQEIIEKKILDSYTSESEILLTYFENGRLLTCYMTVVNMNSLKQSITCTDPYRNKITINFKDIIHIQ